MIPLIQENSNLTTTDEFRIPPQLIELYNDSKSIYLSVEIFFY